MKRKWGKLVAILIIVASIIFICANSYAHSGRTDSSGGHKDNNNKSGLGYYHYHCGGHPAHLHKNGVCPYSKNSSKSSKSKKASNSNKKNTATSTTKKTSSSTKKNNTKSTNTKSSTNATTTTSKATSTPISKETSTMPTTTAKVNKNENNTNIANSSTEDSSAGGTLVALGLLGGGSYFGYKKYKKSKE